MVLIDLMTLKFLLIHPNLPSEFPGQPHLDFKKISQKIKWPNKVMDFQPNLLLPLLPLSFLAFVKDSSIYLAAQGKNPWDHP